MIKKILIIASDRAIRLMAGFTLQIEDYSVVEAASLQEAIDKIDAGLRPDLILNGIDMHLTAGINFIKAVREVPALRHVPILTIASDSVLNHQVEWREAGVTAWVPQPFTGRQLLEMVSLVLF